MDRLCQPFPFCMLFFLTIACFQRLNCPFWLPYFFRHLQSVFSQTNRRPSHTVVNSLAQKKTLLPRCLLCCACFIGISAAVCGLVFPNAPYIYMQTIYIDVYKYARRQIELHPSTISPDFLPNYKSQSNDGKYRIQSPFLNAIRNNFKDQKFMSSFSLICPNVPILPTCISSHWVVKFAFY